MTLDIDEMLAARADSVEPPRFDPQVVLAHGERLVTRRRRRTTALAACALVAVAGITVLTAPGADERVSPAGPSDPTRTTEPGARPLGYVEGTVLHLGPRRFDTGLDALSLDLTDDGAALTTLDGAIWFSDGTGIEQIGATPGGSRIADHGVSWDDSGGSPREWVVSDSEGSLLAWVEYPRGGAPEVVVYDTSTRDEVLREGVPTERTRARTVVAGLAGGEAFAVMKIRGGLSETEWFRFALDGAPPEQVDRGAFLEAIRVVPRALAVSATGGDDVLGVTDGNGGHSIDFDEAIDVRGRQLVGVTYPGTGAVVELELPPVTSVFEAYFLQWLDDDQFTLWVDGDVMVCQLSAESCRLVIDAGWSFGSRDGMPLLPGDQGLGGDWALFRAIRGPKG